MAPTGLTRNREDRPGLNLYHAASSLFLLSPIANIAHPGNNTICKAIYYLLNKQAAVFNRHPVTVPLSYQMAYSADHIR